MQKLAVAAAALTLLAAPVLAQDGSAHEFPLTMSAFLEAYPDTTPETFAQIDTDGDGQVSEDEYLAATGAGLITPTEG